MARIDTLNNFLIDVAESIRTKKGTTDLISPSNFDTEIANIETGGGDISEYFEETISNGNSSIGGWVKTIKKLPAFNFSGTNASYLYGQCYYVEEIDLSGIDTTNTTNMNYMFQYCQFVKQLNVSNFITNNATTMNYMFYYCTSLEELNLNNFITTNVAYMSNMFNRCEKLITLDISNFDMSKVISINSIFGACSRLTNLTFGKNLGLGYLTTASANYTNYKLDLSQCTSLTEISLISVLNGLADIASLGVQTQTCQLGSTNLAKLTSEEGQRALAQAQAYGWTVN